jgi:hypothetical protein
MREPGKPVFRPEIEKRTSQILNWYDSAYATGQSIKYTRPRTVAETQSFHVHLQANMSPVLSLLQLHRGRQGRVALGRRHGLCAGQFQAGT